MKSSFYSRLIFRLIPVMFIASMAFALPPGMIGISNLADGDL